VPSIKHLLPLNPSPSSNPSGYANQNERINTSQKERIYSVLAYHDGMTANEIAIALGVSPSAIWRNLKNLQDEGYIVKRGRAYYIP